MDIIPLRYSLTIFLDTGNIDTVLDTGNMEVKKTVIAVKKLLFWWEGLATMKKEKAQFNVT